MSELDPWLTNPKICEYLATTKVKALRDYLHDKLPLKEAAYELITNYDMELVFNPSFMGIMNCLTIIACDLSDSHKQRKVVKFMVALRNLRYGMEMGFYSEDEMNLRKDLTFVLCELPETIADEHSNLWCEVLAPIRGGGQIRPKSNIQWINLNAFMARLSSVNVCEMGLVRARFMFDTFIQDDDVRENPVIFNAAVSAAAQHMIYSASKFLEFYEENLTLLVGHLGWQKWKAGFKEAQTNSLIDASGKKDAKLAVAAMNEAELVWNSRHMPRGIYEASNDGSYSKEMEMTQRPAWGTKRSHSEAFLDSSLKEA